MADILPFVKPKLGQKAKGSTLCRRGFHRWKVINKPFDVKLGKLVTCRHCERCGVEKADTDKQC